MPGQRKNFSKSKLNSVVAKHFIVAGKIYHWDLLPSGVRAAHQGLGKVCPLFEDQLKEGNTK